MKPIEPWFNNAIVDGVMRLYALSLQGCPPAETVTLTATVWVDTLWAALPAWVEALDARRLAAGFEALAQTAERWPAPAQLLDRMPRRPELPRLPEPKRTPQERDEVLRKVAEIKALFQRPAK